MNELIKIAPDEALVKLELILQLEPLAKTIAILQCGTAFVTAETLSRDDVGLRLQKEARGERDFEVGRSSDPHAWIVRRRISNVFNVYTELDSQTPPHLVGLIARADADRDLSSSTIVAHRNV